LEDIAVGKITPIFSSWAVEIRISEEWAGNDLRFPTQEQAEQYGLDVRHRWAAVYQIRSKPSQLKPSHEYTEGTLTRLTQEES
jgi:hypothetical protein